MNECLADASCAAQSCYYSLTPQGSSFLSLKKPIYTSYGHLFNLTQDRPEAAKGGRCGHLTGRGHPRTCEMLWAGAPRRARGLGPSLVGWGGHRLSGS